VFKGLALNTDVDRVTRQERLGSFSFDFYRPGHAIASGQQEALRDRWSQRYPFLEGARLAEDEWWEVERSRVFPLSYEADQAQRVIPQRSMPWFVPIADNGLMDIYQQIPPSLKLNTRLFRRMVLQVCGPELYRIPDNNTGAAVDAGAASLLMHRYQSALLNRLRKWFSPGIATRGSWPDWEHYVQNSDLIAGLWQSPLESAREMLSGLIGSDVWDRSLMYWQGQNTEFFLRLLTLKLWLEQRDAADHGNPLKREMAVGRA
jgi:hypothetical protein